MSKDFFINETSSKHLIKFIKRFFKELYKHLIVNTTKNIFLIKLKIDLVNEVETVTFQKL